MSIEDCQIVGAVGQGVDRYRQHVVENLVGTFVEVVPDAGAMGQEMLHRHVVVD